MKVQFLKVNKIQEIETVTNLANKIWHEHFTPIIGRAQVEYMLEKFQSCESIARQISNGYSYVLIKKEQEAIGYISFKTENNTLFLSKFYILSNYRNQGYGKQALAFIEQQAIQLKLGTIILTVNKNNTGTISAYKKMGFINRGSIIKDIGNGFVMDDYKMEKTIINSPLHTK